MATTNHFFLSLIIFFFLLFGHAEAHVGSQSDRHDEERAKLNNQQTFNWNFSQKWFVYFRRNKSKSMVLFNLFERPHYLIWFYRIVFKGQIERSFNGFDESSIFASIIIVT